MSLCIAAGGKTLVLAAQLFTLAWTHSIEKVEWRETWQVSDTGLTLAEARVKGSGAGMEPPDGAVLIDGWWVYRPSLPPQKTLILAASGATRSGWTFCADGKCWALGAEAGEPIRIGPCEAGQ